MIFDGESGPATMMYSPEIDLNNIVEFKSIWFSALHMPMNEGSLAVYGNKEESLKVTVENLGRSISW